MTVDCQTPGWLSSMINFGDQQTLENIKVTGYINGSDIKFIRELNLSHNLKGVIDLEEVNIVSGGDAYGYFYYASNKEPKTSNNSISAFMFALLNPIRKIILPFSTTSFNATAFANTDVDTLIINGNMTEIVIGGTYNSNKFWKTRCIYFPEGLKSIDFGYYFHDYSGLTNIELFLPSTLEKISGRTGCINRPEAIIHCASTNPEDILDADPTGVYGHYTNHFRSGTLYVPKGTKEKYEESVFALLTIIEEIPVVHTLTYLVDGETYSTYTLEEGNEISPEDEPTKEGYTFSGWSSIPETMPASDLTITGTFVPNKYKLTYFVDGGEYKTSEIEFGSAITAEDNPTKEGYTFSGWSEIPETMPASDVTITGSFTINKYKLTYTLDGEEYKTAEVDYGTALTPEEAPVKEGYTFSGWSEIPSTMPANDVTVTGTFTANKYKLTYMVDGEEYKTSEVDYGTAITAEAVPTKEGYTFSGWSEIPSTMPAEDVTVTGTFTVNKYTITYMVDNTVLMTEEVAYGSTIAPPKSQKDGYDILWSFYPTTMPAYSITINGTYTTGINGLNVEESERQVFTPDGKRVDTPKKGLNIIRMSDGTVKKVVVK